MSRAGITTPSTWYTGSYCFHACNRKLLQISQSWTADQAPCENNGSYVSKQDSNKDSKPCEMVNMIQREFVAHRGVKCITNFNNASQQRDMSYFWRKSVASI